MKDIFSRGIHEFNDKKAIRVISNEKGGLTIPKDNFFGWIRPGGLFSPYLFPRLRTESMESELNRFMDYLPSTANAYLLHQRHEEELLVSSLRIADSILKKYAEVEHLLKTRSGAETESGKLDMMQYNFLAIYNYRDHQ